MPGHKGKGDILKAIAENLSIFDLTETDGIDSLFSSSCALKQSQEKVAQALGTNQTFFLVNGATVGLQAAIMAVVSKGDSILIPRNSHRSILHGVLLSGATPVYFSPNIDSTHGFATIFEASEIEKMFSMNSSAKAIVVTNPSLYGFCSDIMSISSLCRKHNKILIVDEACGAHFPFSGLLPDSGISCGADIVIHGTHKNLSSLTQSGMMHVNSSVVDIEMLKHYLMILQSSSPSYVLLVSLELAMREAIDDGKSLYSDLYQEIISSSNKLIDARELGIVSGYLKKNGMIYDYDFTKIVVNLNNSIKNSQEVSNWLADMHKLQNEFFDKKNIVFTVGITDMHGCINALHTALEQLSKYAVLDYSTKENSSLYCHGIHIPEMSLLPACVIRANYEKTCLSQCLGRISKENIYSWIAGLPVIRAGEVFDSNVLAYLENIEYNEDIKVVA